MLVMGVCKFVSLSVMQLYCANMAEIAKWIEVLLGVETLVTRNIILHGSRGLSHGFDAAFTRLLWPHVLLVII